MDIMEDCPVKDISLHVRLKELANIGALEESPVFHYGMGSGVCYLHKGTKIKIKRKFVGTPSKWINNLGYEINFQEPHDFAYNPETREIITFAKTL